MFHHRELPLEERMELSYERLRHLNKHLLDGPHSPAAIAQDPSLLTALHEWAGPVDPGLSTILSIHYNLFLGTLTNAEDVHRHDLDPYLNLDRIGVFLCTELLHGNSVKELETRATYDRAAREYVLHTPRPGARKFMPNTSEVGGPKAALVAARLIIERDGRAQDEGVHLFLVPLHDPVSGETLEGITIERLPQTGSAAVDHCLTSFDNVRLPYEAMLQPSGGQRTADEITPHGLTPDGVYTNTFGGALKRFLDALARVTPGKLCMEAYHVGTMRHALTVAIRYAHIRHTFNGVRPGSVPLWHHRSHNASLLGALATGIGATLLHRHAVQTWEQAATEEERDIAERLAAITKSWITWRGREVMLECRERCGAQGLFLANGIVAQLQAGEGAITAEGDNAVISDIAGMELVMGHFERKELRPGPRDLETPESVQDLLGALARIWCDRASERLRPRHNTPRPGGLLNRTMLPARKLATTYADYLAAEGILTAAQQATDPEARRLLYLVHRLFALHRIDAQSGALQAKGYLEEDQVDMLHNLIEDVLDELAPHVLLLVNAQSVSETLLLSHPIMNTDPERRAQPALALTGPGFEGQAR
ncbi:acyl-CoA oxidase [Streptomyces sp. SID625]|nr:acyl-CoA oxidase [Streptomyces sp. SID625]